MQQHKDSISISGYVSANMGLGHTARTFARLALENGLHISLRDIDAGHGRSGHDTSLADHVRRHDLDDSNRIELAIGGADALTGWMLNNALANLGKQSLNAAFLWWELPHLPSDWIEACRGFDVLIAGSDFVYAALANSGANVPVLLARHPLDIPSDVEADRPLFGLAPTDFVVLMGFEPLSNPERKNPFAAIEAFRRAFPSRSDCRLVIKINNAKGSVVANEVSRDLSVACKTDSRITLLTDALPYEKLLSLYAGCDAVLSLHRSEGLGLMPLEAMRLGKPVVATGWSGNMSYMNYRNSCPVNFKLIPTSGEARSYSPATLGKDSFWAEPDIDHAAHLLRMLADDIAFRSRIGRNAKADSEAYDTAARRGGFFTDLAELKKQRIARTISDGPTIRRQVQQARRQMHLATLRGPKRWAAQFGGATAQLLNRHLLWRVR